MQENLINGHQTPLHRKGGSGHENEWITRGHAQGHEDVPCEEKMDREKDLCKLSSIRNMLCCQRDALDQVKKDRTL